MPAGPAPTAPAAHRSGSSPAAAAAALAPAAPAPAVAPFGVDDPAALRAAPAPAKRRAKERVGLLARCKRFFRSFVDEDESYKSPLAGPDLESTRTTSPTATT